MNASVVKVQPRTIGYYEHHLSRKKRRQLREAAVIALIDSKPAGTRIRLSQFAAAVQVKPTSVNSLLMSMLRQNKIGKVNITPKTYSWYTHTGEKASKPQAQSEAATKPVPPPAPQPAAPEKITELARSFAWDYNSDSLREFIKYLGERAEQ